MMATQLTRFTDAYATITVATYEPLIVRWVSLWGIGTIATDLALRSPRARLIAKTTLPTAVALGDIRVPTQGLASLSAATPAEALNVEPSAVDADGYPLPRRSVRSALVRALPDAVAVGRQAFANGVVRRVNGGAPTRPAHVGSFIARALSAAGIGTRDPVSYNAVRTVPLIVNRAARATPPADEFRAARTAVLAEMNQAVNAAVANPDGEFTLDLNEALKGKSYTFFPAIIEEALSPIGLAHFFRQLYFNIEEGVGPLEQAFTIAPLETLEVVSETRRKQTHEEQLEQGFESVSESATETKNLDEVADKVSSMIQRDASAAMSASVSGGIGVWQGSAEASANMATSTERSREDTSRRLKEVTKRASERITLSSKLVTRDFDEYGETNLARRVIRNESADPVSYGLRRVLRRVRVKVQDLGPRLVWQIYVCEPGSGLATSKFVHFRTPTAVVQPDMPPGAPPRPQGGTETGSTSCAVGHDRDRDMHFLTLVIAAGAGRVVDAVAIDAVTDLAGGGSDDPAPAPRNDQQWEPAFNPTTGTYTVKIGIKPGDSDSVTVAYTYTWSPSPDVIAAWKRKVAALRAAATEALLQQQFEHEKELITESRRIRPRPAADLRREERYEVLNRMISQLFARGEDPSFPSPLEIEYFHRFFDIEGMFTYTHPSWWKPRYAATRTGIGRPAYAITADSEPAPLGSSLGWMIQLDGDARRNEFINSPWVRACLPIRRDRERAALAWLAKHIEGDRGYGPDREPLRTLLADIDERNAAERALGTDGPEYVTIDTTVSINDDVAKASGVYPVIAEFDVTVPTDGFVYERLEIAGEA